MVALLPTHPALSAFLLDSPVDSFLSDRRLGPACRFRRLRVLPVVALAHVTQIQCDSACMLVNLPSYHTSHPQLP